MARVILTITNKSVDFNFGEGNTSVKLSYADALRFSQDIVTGVREGMEEQEKNKSNHKRDKLMDLIDGLTETKKKSPLTSDMDDFLCGMLASMTKDVIKNMEKKARAKAKEEEEEEESEKNLVYYYGTFGSGHVHAKRYVRLSLPTYERAATEMNSRFGDAWGNLYPSKQAAGVGTYNLTELTLEESIAESEKNLKDYYATFGSSDKHNKNYVTIKAISMSAAIVKMTEHYGDKWSQMYPDKEEAGIVKYELTEIFPE